jgi:hypothetical protein
MLLFMNTIFVLLQYQVLRVPTPTCSGQKAMFVVVVVVVRLLFTKQNKIHLNYNVPISPMYHRMQPTAWGYS